MRHCHPPARKFVVFRNDNNIVLRFARCLPTETPPQSTTTLTVVPYDWSNEMDLHKASYRWDPVSRTVSEIPRPVPISTLKLLFRAALNNVCTDAIAKGFTSTATGLNLEYPTDNGAQNNMVQASIVGGLLKAQDRYRWHLVWHNPEQAKAVLKAFVEFKDSVRLVLEQKLALVDAATTQTELDAIKWIQS